MSETVSYLGDTVTITQENGGLFKFTYKNKNYDNVNKIPINDEFKTSVKAKRNKMLGIIETQKVAVVRVIPYDQEQEQEQEQEQKQASKTPSKKQKTDTPNAPSKQNKDPLIAITLSSTVECETDVDALEIVSTDKDVCFLKKNNLHDMLHDFREANDERIKNVFYGNILGLVDTEVNNLFGGAGTAVHPVTASILSTDTLYEPVGLNIRDSVEQSLRPFFDEEYSNLVSNFFLHLYDDNNASFDIKNRNKELFLYENAVENIAPYNVFVEKVYDFIEEVIKKTNVSLSVLINALYKFNSKRVIDDLRLLNVQKGGNGKTATIDYSQQRKVTNKLIRMVASEFDTWFCSDCKTENTYNHFLSAQDDILQQSISGEGQASSKSNADISIYKAVREIMCSNVEKKYEENKDDYERINNYVKNVKNNSKNKFIIDNSAKKFPFKGSKKFAKDNTICIQSTADDGITSNPKLGHPCAGVTDGVEVTNRSMNIIFKSEKRSVQYIRDEHKDNDNWCIIWRKYRTKEHGKQEWGAKLKITNNGLSANGRLRACVKELAKLMDNNFFKRSTDVSYRRRQIAITAYSQLSFKLLGDLLQEIDGTFKNGGRVNAPTYPQGVEAFDTNGDAKRLVISTDQPSAARLMWMFYNGNNFGRNCNGESSDWSKYLNEKARGGYYYFENLLKYFIYDPKDGIVAHSENNTLVPHKSKLNVGRLFTNMLSSFENYQKQLYHRFVYNDYLIQRYTFYSDNQCYETDTTKGYINSMPDFLNSLSYVENPIIELPHPVLLNILNEKLLLAPMQVKDIGNIIYNPNQYGFQDCTKNFVSFTAYGYNNLQTGFDVIKTIPKNSRIMFTYREGSSEELHLNPYGPSTHVRRNIRTGKFIPATINGNQVIQFNLDDKKIILNTQYYLLDSVKEQNRIMQENVDQFFLDINTNVVIERLSDTTQPIRPCIDECDNPTIVTPVQVNRRPSSSTPRNSSPSVKCEFKNGKYIVTIDGNKKEFDTLPTSKDIDFHKWVEDKLYPGKDTINKEKRRSIYVSISKACNDDKGKKRAHSGGAQTIQQETYQDPLTYAIVAIGAFAAMMIGLQK